MLYLGKVLSFLLLPPGLCGLFLVLGLLLLLIGGRSDKIRHKGLVLTGFGVLLFLLFSLNPVADLLLRPLENSAKALASAPEGLNKADYEDCAAVVVLGGGNVEASPEEGGKSSPSSHALKRVAYAVRLAKTLNLPVVFTGGAVYPHKGGEAEAPAAARYLAGLGIPNNQITLEDKSKSTWENAQFVTKLFADKRPEASRLIIVTSAFHMRRALMSFQKQGANAVPAPTDYMAQRVPYTWESWFPDASAMEKSYIAIHEYAGLVAYALRPKASKK
jgi:uncharacterized SAM-binding protein YcdF (DUF218 family)